MKREHGSREFPIWLIGDSNPARWQTQLDYPLDPRHPARHNIWTPILDRIQERVYLPDRLRMDTSLLYVRNAVEDPAYKSLISGTQWENPLLTEVTNFGKLVKAHSPKIIFTFGSFAFEFARRSTNESGNKTKDYWNTQRLGQEFCSRSNNFNIQKINVLPLLHTSIAWGHFLQAHRNFTGQEGANYFEYAADAIAEILIEHRGSLPIWKECPTEC